MTRPSKLGVSFRFDPGVVERLKKRAREAGATQATLVERYVDEGVRMDDHPGIYFRDEGSGRRPAVLGTGLDVAQVIETLRQNDNSPDATADYLDISAAHVDTALRYYAAYEDEIDAWIEQSRAVAERERELWRRREATLAR